MTFFNVMIAYNRPEMIRGAMQTFCETVSAEEMKFIDNRVFFCQYPLPSVESNRLATIELAKEFNWKYEEIQNLGCMQNWNQVIHEHLSMKSGDFLMTYDSDCRITKPGWVSAFVEALSSDQQAMFCCTARDFHHHEWMQTHPYNRKIQTLPSGLRIARYDCLIAWASGVWKAEFLNSRPRDFGLKGCYYGESEASDSTRLRDYGKTWISLADYIDHHMGAMDQEYTDWKLAWAHAKTLLPFDQWIKERK
jgi:hypothetical protein